MDRHTAGQWDIYFPQEERHKKHMSLPRNTSVCFLSRSQYEVQSQTNDSEVMCQTADAGNKNCAVNRTQTSKVIFDLGKVIMNAKVTPSHGTVTLTAAYMYIGYDKISC